MKRDDRQHVNWYRRFKRAQAKAAAERRLRRQYEAEAKDARHELERLRRECHHLKGQVARLTFTDGSGWL